MSNIIMIGCDLHDRSLLIRFAVGKGEPREASFSNDTLVLRPFMRIERLITTDFMTPSRIWPDRRP